jgi:hypothetical protein
MKGSLMGWHVRPIDAEEGLNRLDLRFITPSVTASRATSQPTTQSVQIPDFVAREVGMLHLQLALANQEIARLNQALESTLKHAEALGQRQAQVEKTEPDIP